MDQNFLRGGSGSSQGQARGGFHKQKTHSLLVRDFFVTLENLLSQEGHSGVNGGGGVIA